MLNRLKQLRAAWRLTGKLDTPGAVEGIDTETLKKMLEVDMPLGDGKAEYLGDEMSEPEFQEYAHNEENGWGAALKKLWRQ